MNPRDEVRRALQPLIDQGVITDIEESLTPPASYVPGPIQPPQRETFNAIIPAWNRQSYKAQIDQLLFEAGLMDKVSVGIQEKSKSARA